MGIKISQLPDLVEATLSDLLPLVQNNVTYKATVEQIIDLAVSHTVLDVATTGNLSATYNNGTAGEGATLVNNSTLAALVIDGISVVVGNTVLVKDQSAQVQNGKYVVTIVGDGATAWILTRSSDYDDPDQIVAGGSFTISSGTLNALTQWLETAVVVVIGTDPIIFSSPLFSSVSSSATPGTFRALVGSIKSSATTITSGNLVGVRGAVTVIGASGGFLYGVQGKVIASGTLSGSSWTAGVFGQLDISAATINAGQTAALWGDYGSSSGTLTNVTGMRGVAMTNTTAAILHAQDYRYGNATYLWELAGAGGTLAYFANAGTGGSSCGNTTYAGANKVLTLSINGTNYYVPLFASNA